MDPEAKWTKLEKVLVESADKIIPKKPAMTQNKWMTTEILDLVLKRRTVKNKKCGKYQTLDKEIKEKCVRAKEKWMCNVQS